MIYGFYFLLNFVLKKWKIKIGNKKMYNCGNILYIYIYLYSYGGLLIMNYQKLINQFIIKYKLKM